MSEIQITSAGAPNLVYSSDGGVTLTVPIQIKRRAGCKRITFPSGEAGTLGSLTGATTSLQLALVRGFRWLTQLESGEVESLRELARREGVDNSYVSRMVNLTILSPLLVRAILADELPGHVTLFDLAVNPDPLWEAQNASFFSAEPE